MNEHASPAESPAESQSLPVTASPPPTKSPPVTAALSLPVRFKRYLRDLAFRMVIYLLFYLLISIATIGPCFWSWHEAMYAGGQSWIAKIYAPLVWLCDACEPVGWLVNEYVDWWIK